MEPGVVDVFAEAAGDVDLAGVGEPGGQVDFFGAEAAVREWALEGDDGEVAGGADGEGDGVRWEAAGFP